MFITYKQKIFAIWPNYINNVNKKIINWNIVKIKYKEPKNIKDAKVSSQKIAIKVIDVWKSGELHYIIYYRDYENLYFRDLNFIFLYFFIYNCVRLFAFDNSVFKLSSNRIWSS